MDSSCILVALGMGAAVGIVAAAVTMLLGGYGGYLRTARAVNLALDEVERVEGRLEREVKARAALSARKTDPVVDDLIRSIPTGGTTIGSRRAEILRKAGRNAI